MAINFSAKVFGLGVLAFGFISTVFGADITPTRVGPVSQYGQLMTGKNSQGQGRIYGSCEGVKDGAEVQVRGMSLYWSLLPQAVEFWSEEGVATMVNDMNIQIVRAAMATGDEDWGNGYKGYDSDPTTQMNLMKTVVEAAIKNDIYVIIDWHSHHANEQTSAAKNFFKQMAQTYGQYDNVIFELFNEPEDIAWGTIKNYADQVVSVIREYSDNLILVGTPKWDQNPQVAIGNEVSDPKKNTAYTLHYYANSHCWSGTNSWGGACEGTNGEKAMNAGLSVFVSEWGTADANGGGDPDQGRNQSWQEYINKHKLSWANWSASKVSEGTAAFTGGASKTSLQYTTSGKLVKGYLASNPTSYQKCKVTYSSSSAVSSSSEVSEESSSSVASSSSETVLVSSSSFVQPEGTTDYIDDLEDGNNFAFTGGEWYAYTDEGVDGASTITNAENDHDGYDVVIAGSSAGDTSKFVVGLTGVKLSKGNYEYDPYVALGVSLKANETAYDLSNCKTITYRYKGAKHYFKVEDVGVEDYGFHQISKPASSVWTTTTVSWDKLTQESWAEPVTLSKKRINKLTWEIKKTASNDYLYVDDVRCLEMAIVPVQSSSSVASSSSETVVVSSSSEASSSSAAVVSSSSAESSSSVASSSSQEQAPVSSSSEEHTTFAASQIVNPLKLYVEGRLLHIGGAQWADVNVFDLQGRPVASFKQAKGAIVLDMLRQGNYVVRVRSGSNSLIKRISIK